MSLAEYEVGKAIGSGKFSVVFKAKRKSDGQTVALKRVQIFDIMDQKQREKCLKEVRLLQSLDHPNIIKYIDSFIDENDLIIVFEWAELGDLRKLLRKAAETGTPIEEGMIWKYFVQLCDSLKYMHEQRIMHRDLKPANVFITASGYLKLGDLGLGRSFSSQSFEAFSKVGTPLYMSPEVIHGKGYDWQSDVWSLGCILYEMATLRNPFKEDDINLYDLFKKINSCSYRPLAPTFSVQLRELVARLLQVDPKKRPTSAELFEISRRECVKYMNLKPRMNPAVAMEAIVDKLKLLNYETQFCKPRGLRPIHRLFFAIPSPSSSEQWEYFAALSLWLLQLSGARPPTDDALLDPNTLAQHILSELRALDILVDFAASKLRTGSGELICNLLDSLLDRALKHTHFQFFIVNHPDHPEILEEVTDESKDEIQELPKRAVLDEPDEVDSAEEGPCWSSGNRNGSTPRLPLPPIGPPDTAEEIRHAEAWTQEASRVTRQLQLPLSPVQATWQDRATVSRHFSQLMDADVQRAAGTLMAIQNDIAEALQAVQRVEATINRSLPHLVEERTRACAALQAGTKEYESWSEIVDGKSKLLSRLAHELQFAQNAWQEQSDALTNARPVQELKKAIQTLKNDSVGLEMQLAVAQHELLRRRRKARQEQTQPSPQTSQQQLP